jgi:glycosyltransferase involved in cell wall biosynthesis
MLAEAIESVLDQTYEPVELVVVDDGPPTSARPVVESLAGDAVFHRFDRNRGANVARNEGIRRSSGEYVQFLDDDDRWEPRKLAKQVAALEADDDVGVSYTGQRYSGERTSVTREIPSIRGEATRELFAGRYVITFSCLLVRRSAIHAAGYPDPELPILQDREWLFRLSQHTKLAAVEEPLVFRRVGGHEQISDRYEELRDVAYPRIYGRHRRAAGEIGLRCRLQFKASLLAWIGSLALYTGRYRDARRYLFAAYCQWPFSLDVLLRLIVSLGGDSVHQVGQSIREALRRARSPRDRS